MKFHSKYMVNNHTFKKKLVVINDAQIISLNSYIFQAKKIKENF